MADLSIEATLLGDSTVTAEAYVQYILASSLTGDSAVVAVSQAFLPIGASLLGASNTTAEAHLNLGVAVPLNGTSNATAGIIEAFALGSVQTGSSTFNITMQGEVPIEAVLVGTSTTSADLEKVVNIDAVLEGTSTETATANTRLGPTANLNGASAVNATCIEHTLLHAVLNASSTIYADIRGFVPVSARMYGESTLTAFATPEQGLDLGTAPVSFINFGSTLGGVVHQNTLSPYRAYDMPGTVNVYPILPGLAVTIHGNGLYRAEKLPGLQGCIDCDYIVGDQPGPVLVMYDQGHPGYPAVPTNPNAIIGILLDPSMRPIAFITDISADIKAYSASTGPVLTIGQRVHFRFSWNTREPFASFTVNGQEIAWTTYPSSNWQAVMPTNIAVGYFAGGTTNGDVSLAQIGRIPV